MINNKKGFTLVELIIMLSILSIISLMASFIPVNAYYEALLKSTAAEIKDTLHMAQQLSLNESKEYCVELIAGRFRVRENVASGNIVFSKNFDRNIFKSENSYTKISYNRNGETNYGVFILENKRGQKIDIEVSIGTGRVKVSNVY